MTPPDKQALVHRFREDILEYVDVFNEAVATNNGDWVVKGFIDIAKNIYTISADTKVVSKIMELLLFPKISQFAADKEYRMVLCKEQNFYPDVTFIDKYGNKFAMDFKSTYRKSNTSVNGMTLGAFTGYFRDRQSTKNITFPYADYIAHLVLGLVYSRSDEAVDERKVYRIDDLQNIASVITDFEFFVQEKYTIALDRPGSGNTKNIGSVTNLSDLIQGNGPFAALGVEVFDDYWMFYLTKDMARAADLQRPPYTNLAGYRNYRNLREII